MKRRKSQQADGGKANADGVVNGAATVATESKEVNSTTTPKLAKTQTELSGEPTDAPAGEKKKKRKRRRKSKKRGGADEDEDDDDRDDEKEEEEVKADEKKEKPAEVEKATGEKEDAGEDTKKVRDDNGEHETPEPMEADDQPTAKKSKKEKREKKEKKPRPTEPAEQVEELSFRHKALLDKKAKSLQRARETANPDANDGGIAADAEAQPAELHGLEPLPQPEAVLTDANGVRPSYQTLPPWLADPVRVLPTMRKPFAALGVSPEYGIDSRAEAVLRGKGWAEAVAIQTAVIPMLLPHGRHGARSDGGGGGRGDGDLIISAATGSGKTLAYVLPVLRDVSRSSARGGGGGGVTRLRAVVVVPTRELVQQVQDVCETCARAFAAASQPASSVSTSASVSGKKTVRIGVAVGSQSFRKEQAALVEEEQVYDPEGYQALLRARQQWPFGADGHENEGGQGTAEETFGLPDPATTLPLPDHVVRHVSSVDVLICTPGRLVEHLQATPGFSLDYVRWLVVDEADKLLGQSYQQWLAVVMDRLAAAPSNAGLLGARDAADAPLYASGVRKVVLSATMTRDLSLLNSLQLRRPTHVILDGTGASQAKDDAAGAAEYALPDGLQESAIKVRDEAHKPLYLVDLLNSALLQAPKGGEKRASGRDVASSSESDSDSDSDSDTSSNSGSSSNDSDSDSDSKARPFNSTVLIFAKSNENALRLSRLLALLAPALAPLVGTITSTTRTSERRRTLRAFASDAPERKRILVATDLAARGIDLPHLDHVVNYDMPPSVEFYVHRVGRTARAGRAGHAWTLYTKKEAGWFWPAVAGQGQTRSASSSSASASVVRRARKVSKVVVGGGGGGGRRRSIGQGDGEGDDDTSRAQDWFGEARLAAYEDALEQLGREAAGTEGRRM